MRCQNADALEAWKTLGRKFKAQEGARLVELLKTHIGIFVVLLLFYSSKFQPKSINAKMNP